VSLDFEIQTVS